MKIALIGKGKTGGQILNLNTQHQIEVFDSKNNITVGKLKDIDVAIAFVDGKIFKNLIPILIESKIPVITGSTGLNWQDHTDELLIQHNLKWITSSNFSLGMRIAHEMILKLKNATQLFQDYRFSMNEIHHTKKLDAPSGTALSWEKWIGEEVNINSERIGDTVGIHEIILNTPYEKITLKHEAIDRKIFAEGALWAANYLTQNNDLAYGLHYFETIVKNKIDNNK